MTTIADIAQNIGVSPATVSRALNGKMGVSEPVRVQILAEASRLNFAANGAARSLATTRTDNVAFAIYQPPLTSDQFFGAFYSRIMFGAEQELQRQERHLLITTLTDEHIARPEQWSVARGRRADGVIVAGPVVPSRFITALYTMGLPAVLVDNAIAGAPIDAVLGDDRSGARQVAEHLLGHGHKRVVVIAGPKDWITNRERCAGFGDALLAARVKPLAILHADATTHDTGYALTRQALEHRPTAILAINDAMAMGAIDAAQAAGLSVPGDIAVTGYDDIDPARHIGVPLTTVHVHKQHLGRVAAQQLLNRIAQPDAPHQRVLMETSVIVRNSCGCDAPARTPGPGVEHTENGGP